MSGKEGRLQQGAVEPDRVEPGNRATSRGYVRTPERPRRWVRLSGEGETRPMGQLPTTERRPRRWTGSLSDAQFRRGLRAPTNRGEGVPEGQTEAVVGRREHLSRWLLAWADVLAATVSVLAGVELLGDERLRVLALIAIPLVVGLSKVIGLYDRDENLITKTTLDEAPMLFQVASLYVLLLWLGESWLVDGTGGAYFAKQQVLGIWGVMIVSMVLFRYSARRIVRAFTSEERCLVLGDPRSAARMQQKLSTSARLKATVVGRVSLSDERRKHGGPPLLGNMEMLGLVLAEHEVQRVIIAPRSSDSEEILHAIRLSKAMGVRVSVLPRLFEVVGSSVAFDDLEGLPLLGVRRGGLSRSSRAVKRSIDLAASTVGVLVLLPVIAIAGLAVKLSSPGPVLFRQDRIGRDGHVFSMVKFRSMVQDADKRKTELEHMNEAAGGFFKIAEDPRVTRVGKLLRRTYLDELPQLFNVLRGHMSLVGPRPLVPDEDDRIEGHHRSRLELTPGMTGMWQVLGSSRVPLEEMVKIDYLYGANWTPWLDLKILLRTFSYALGRSGL